MEYLETININDLIQQKKPIITAEMQDAFGSLQLVVEN